MTMTTRVDQWGTASTGRQDAGHADATPHSVGELHAFRPDDSATYCGLRLVGMRRWPQVPFRGQGGCLVCDEVTVDR